MNTTGTFRTILPPEATSSEVGRIVLHLTLASLLAFGVDPLRATLLHDEENHQNDTNNRNDSDGSNKKQTHRRRRHSLWSALVDGSTSHMATAARVYLLLVILAELYVLVPTTTLLGSNQQIPHQNEEEEDATTAPNDLPLITPTSAASLSIVLWLGLTASTVKHTLLLQSVAGHSLGRVALVDRFLDVGIAIVTVLNMMDILDMDLSNMGVQSILSAGGVGALVFSLASQDLAQGLVGGLAVQAWDAFKVGEMILLGDGTEGTVVEIGLVETHVKGYDAIVTRIPNRQLTTARVSNLSRVKTSRVVQSLRFHYEDLDKIPAVLEAIRAEIQKRCPTVITDGSAAFLAVLEEYHADHIRGLVIANFAIPPRTLEFMSTRQDCLLAIARAMKTNGVAFAIPTMEYRGTHHGNHPPSTTTTTTKDLHADLEFAKNH